MNSLVAGSSSRTRARLASLSVACCRVAIVTGLTALTPRPGRVVETLLWGRGGGGRGEGGKHGIKKEEVSSRRGKEEGKRETYHTAARLGVAAAGVTVALAPLAGAQVKAGAGARVAVVALLQSAERKEEKKKGRKAPQVRDKCRQRGNTSLFHCSTEIGTLQLSSKTEVG